MGTSEHWNLKSEVRSLKSNNKNTPTKFKMVAKKLTKLRPNIIVTSYYTSWSTDANEASSICFPTILNKTKSIYITGISERQHPTIYEWDTGIVVSGSTSTPPPFKTLYGVVMYVTCCMAWYIISHPREAAASTSLTKIFMWIFITSGANAATVRGI